jgi:HK97 family phage portal protein
MGFWNDIRNRFRLTESERKTIWKVFGSFASNKLAMEGNQVLSNSYGSNVDVFSVIRKIVEVQKTQPWVVEQYMGGRWKELKDTSIHELMDSPNVGKGYCWDDIEEMMCVFLLVTGNTYLFGQRGIGSMIEEVDVLPSPNVCIESNTDFFMPEFKYIFEFENKKRTLTNEDLTHVRYFNPSYTSVKESLYGLSPIKVAATVVQNGIDRWDANSSLLQNRGALGIITDKSDRPMSPKQAEQAQEAVDERISGINKQGKTIVTNKDLNFIQLAMSPEDLKLIEMGVVNLRSICNVYNLDSSLFNDPDNKTYSNRTEAEKAMYTNCIMPLSNKLAENLTNFLCKNHFPGRKVRMRQDFKDVPVLQNDFEKLSKPYIELRKIGVMTANNVNEALNLPKQSDPMADQLLIIQGNQPQTTNT